MNLKDENEKKQEEIGQERTDTEKQNVESEKDNDEIDNSEDLELKKREINKFHVEDNSAQNQIFIQDVGTGGFTVNYYAQKMVSINPKLPVEKRYDLRKKGDCIEFVETFKNSEYFTTAIVLCILEAVALADLPNLKSRMICFLPEDVLYNSEGNAVHILKKSPYISLDSVLAVIGGKKFITENGQQCVSLGKNSIQAWTNMLEQFPALQDSVIEWLLWIAEDDKYGIVFYRYQIATSLAQIISYKPVNVKNRIFSGLYTNMNNVYLLAILVYELYMDKNEKEEAETIIWQWIHSDQTWLWRPACLGYALFEENGIPFICEKELRKMLSKRILHFRGNDLDFMAELLIQSKSFRTMLCNILYNVYNQTETGVREKSLAQSYINLVRRSFYKVNSFFIELPLVACDTKMQQDYLTNILEKVMAEYHLRKQIYAILKVYLKEISHYDFSEKVIKHIAAYFYNMSLVGEEYEEDIIEFLKECHSRASRQIVDLL